MTPSFKIISLCLLFLINARANAQGCSDAGFCTMGNLGQHTDAGKAKQKITVLLPFGLGDESVFVVAPGIQYDNQLNKNWSVQAKLTGNYATGNLGNAAGLGDVFLSGTYAFPANKKDWQWSVSLGTKLPLNSSNIKEDGLSLPMQYQSSLGTVDVITGVALSNTKWQFAAGWQQPLTGTNGNNFLPVYSMNIEAEKYIPSNDFNRKGDVLLRGVYKHILNDKLFMNAGLLGIYHLGKDTYIDGNVSNKPISIEGSDGITLNATISGWYQVNKKITIGLTLAAPLVVRKLRPDGLTRSFVAAPEISWSF